MFDVSCSTEALKIEPYQIRFNPQLTISLIHFEEDCSLTIFVVFKLLRGLKGPPLLLLVKNFLIFKYSNGNCLLVIIYDQHVSGDTNRCRAIL